MRASRAVVLALLMSLLGLVVQATLFRRFNWLTPDLVVLVVCASALTLHPSSALLVGFLSGAMVDLSIASSVLGLRALVYTVVAYLAIRTRTRAESGFLVAGIWIGLLTLTSVVLLLVVGITFGQSGELGSQIVPRLIQVPLSNFLIGSLLAAPLTRLLQPGRGVTA